MEAASWLERRLASETLWAPGATVAPGNVLSGRVVLNDAEKNPRVAQGALRQSGPLRRQRICDRKSLVRSC